MNKISKKIVSLVTMAAFALTLVPAAAFAAPETKTDYTVSEATTANYNKTTVSITLSDEDVADLNGTDDTNAGNIVVWAEKANENVASDVTYDNVTSGFTVEKWGSLNGEAPAAVHNMGVVTGTFDNDLSLDLTFATTGDYKVYVALNKDGQFADYATTKAAATAKDFHAYGVGVAKESVYGVIENTAAVDDEVAVGDKLTTNFIVFDANEKATPAPFNGTVWVWAQEGDDISNFATFDGNKDNMFNAYSNTNVSQATDVNVTFSKTGTYTLHAGVGATLPDAMANEIQGTSTIKVVDKNVEAAKIVNAKAKIEQGSVTNTTTKNITFKNGIGDLDLTDTDFAYDGIDKITISGKVVDENNEPVIGKKITATTNKDSVVELDNNAESDVTDQYGEFEITFEIKGQSNATVTLVDEDDNISYTIQIWAKKTTADNIDRTLTGGYVLAGNDSKYGDAVYGGNATVSFADAVQFKVTGDGEEMTGDAAIAGSKIDIRVIPSNPDSTLKNVSTTNGAADNDLALVWDEDNGVYTLAYVGGNNDGTYKTDLIPGKYEVRVALANGDDATVTFNVAKFGTVQDTVLDITARDYDQSPANPNEEVMSVDDTITLGQQVTVTAKYVDGNGIKVPAKYVSFNFNGKAVSDWSKWNNVFATQMDIPANESLIGTTVKVVAFNTANKQLVEKTLTVADSYTDKSLEFSSDNGAISKDNKVNVTVVDANGKTQQVEGYMTAWVADQSNEDAKISVDVNKNGAHDVQNGKGSLTVYADQETTADIVVVVKAGTEAYYGTLEYTFGAEDALANRTVVMTIDSTEYVVNNKIITGDAAPYIDSNWRTMVPIRALAESFDAEVIWNQDDSTVTINFDGDTQIVMTVGETAYTVDGAEATMDTEPVNAGDRVYVPVRFAAEGLGFNVLPLYNEAGLTASVVFQK